LPSQFHLRYRAQVRPGRRQKTRPGQTRRNEHGQRGKPRASGRKPGKIQTYQISRLGTTRGSRDRTTPCQPIKAGPCTKPGDASAGRTGMGRREGKRMLISKDTNCQRSNHICGKFSIWGKRCNLSVAFAISFAVYSAFWGNVATFRLPSQFHLRYRPRVRPGRKPGHRHKTRPGQTGNKRGPGGNAQSKR